ncbi:hypothetical protein OG548_08125 [Streptomyces sp. NBC_01356]|uniref:hypothetical protein n=1 Tax=Streptomyces sp. NBC_01356 TaxID=2903836 RepID=UPI002E32AAB0|nr:hypothetical protein [Streptomyces sp. NBC_01356]
MKLREIPEFKLSAEARDHMRSHVYVNVSVTDRNPDGKGYRQAGYRTWVTRDEWYSATDAEREAAIQAVCASVAKISANRP